MLSFSLLRPQYDFILDLFIQFHEKRAVPGDTHHHAAVILRVLLRIP